MSIFDFPAFPVFSSFWKVFVVFLLTSLFWGDFLADLLRPDFFVVALFDSLSLLESALDSAFASLAFDPMFAGFD